MFGLNLLCCGGGGGGGSAVIVRFINLSCCSIDLSVLTAIPVVVLRLEIFVVLVVSVRSDLSALKLYALNDKCPV